MANEGGAEVRRVDRAATRRSEELPLLARPDLLLADAVLGASRAPCHHACSVTRPPPYGPRDLTAASQTVVLEERYVTHAVNGDRATFGGEGFRGEAAGTETSLRRWFPCSASDGEAVSTCRRHEMCGGSPSSRRA
jgi:hypothetical protein